MFHPINTWRKSSRLSKIVASVVTLVMIPSVAFAAMYLLNLGVGGSLQDAGVQFSIQSATLPAVNSNNGDTCKSVSVAADGQSFTVAPGTGAFPGDTCTIAFVVSAPTSNTTVGELDSLVSPSLAKGWQAQVTNGCGTQIVAGGTLNGTLVFTDVSAPTDGSSVSLSGTQIGLSPASQAPTSPTCTVAN